PSWQPPVYAGDYTDIVIHVSDPSHHRRTGQQVTVAACRAAELKQVGAVADAFIWVHLVVDGHRDPSIPWRDHLVSCRANTVADEGLAGRTLHGNRRIQRPDIGVERHRRNHRASAREEAEVVVRATNVQRGAGGSRALSELSDIELNPVTAMRW